jgi:hypothetical protein
MKIQKIRRRKACTPQEEKCMSHKAKELKDVLTNGEVCISNVFRTIL